MSSHSTLHSQVASLTSAWEWTSTDHLLHVLPLHHIHGVVNGLFVPLHSGAHVTFLDGRFDPLHVWAAFTNLPLTVFQAVPTIYSRLIQAYDAAAPEVQKQWREACGRFRVMISGSAALPSPVLRRWKEISGHTLLERYGMTEIGMALSNPLHGERREGYVGKPLPGVQVKVKKEEGEGGGGQGGGGKAGGEEGELLVKGGTVFSRYWNKPDATAAAFDDEGWFKTGDVVRVDEEGWYKIVGRASVDVLKVAGYKISALEVERDIAGHEGVEECVVVGVPDEEYGQVVGVMVVVKKGWERMDAKQLQEWCKKRMSREKVPRLVKFVDDIPKNAMGKVAKKQLVERFK